MVSESLTKDINWDDLVVVASVVKAHGLKGTFKVKVETDNPKRFLPGESLLLVLPNRMQEVTVESFVPQNRYGLLKLSEISEIEQAEPWRGADLAIPSSELGQLEPGRYYTFQLLGLTVLSQDARNLGVLTRIEEMPSGDIYLVKSQEGDFYIPAMGDIIERIDLDKGVMIIRDMEGLR
jgi:16S rRNA processing protein RimM